MRTLYITNLSGSLIGPRATRALGMVREAMRLLGGRASTTDAYSALQQLLNDGYLLVGYTDDEDALLAAQAKLEEGDIFQTGVDLTPEMIESLLDAKTRGVEPTPEQRLALAAGDEDHLRKLPDPKAFINVAGATDADEMGDDDEIEMDPYVYRTAISLLYSAGGNPVLASSLARNLKVATEDEVYAAVIWVYLGLIPGLMPRLLDAGIMGRNDA